MLSWIARTILILQCTTLPQIAYAIADPVVRWDRYIIQEWGQSACSEGQRITTLEACRAASQSYAAACKTLVYNGTRKEHLDGPFGCRMKISSAEFQFNQNKDDNRTAEAPSHSLICELPSRSNHTECYASKIKDFAEWPSEDNACKDTRNCSGSNTMVAIAWFGGAVIVCCFVCQYMFACYVRYNEKRKCERPVLLITPDVLGHQVRSEELSQTQDPTSNQVVNPTAFGPTGVASGEILSMQPHDQSGSSMTVVGIPVENPGSDVTEGAMVK
eukprot:gnl/MRDRNA2_/MRDRNA2_85444_c0_seq1.p1 gnl/MRDRNA2_/MRDRNA2_85444_c0~~gnl/MRDRNA2_/MRDRNA2_85444_c0_seq1.p1  ORF type:complete len:273 (+),score=31.69 gnl/MRDRNA2_/MRDRNA2_85444_c0_seq1:142-960(+)